MSRLDITKQEEFIPYLGKPRVCVVCGSEHKKVWARDGIFQAVQCQLCGLVWMDPFLTHEGLQKYYSHYLQFRLDDPKKMVQRDRMYELDADFLQQFVHSGRLLDVGCSAGYFLNKLSSEFTKFGIELDEQAVQEAYKRGFTENEIKLAELGDEGFTPEGFDVITMRGVIEHLPEPDQAMARVAELLKPGGWYYITATPNVASFAADLYREKWNLWDPFQHIYHFSTDTLARLAARYGLELVAQAYPYLETPYANPPADHLKILRDYFYLNEGQPNKVERSGAFWGNMLTVLFQKKPASRKRFGSQSAINNSAYLQKFQDPDHCYVIAEAGLNHNGSLKTAKQLIDIAVIAGADAVKFQKRTVPELAIASVLDAPDDRFPEFGTTYREVREYLEFNKDEYAELIAYSKIRGIDFLCSAFDIPAADFLQELGVEAFKLASHSLTNLPLLEHVATFGKPVILSTGMCELNDIDTAVQIFQKHQVPLILMHCISIYPTPAADCNLAMLTTLRDRYHIPVGYSGHELGYVPTLASVAMGAAVIERHFTLDATLPGFDHKISLEPAQLIQMIKDIRATSVSRGHGQKYVSKLEQMKLEQYHVSLVSAQPIPTGAVISKPMITYKNPGTGIPPRDEGQIIGKKAKQDIPADTLLSHDMVE